MRALAIFLVLVAILAGAVTVGSKGAFCEEVRSKLVMEAGHKVWLFHSGTPDVKKEICLNEIIPVYREVKVGERYQITEVGKLKVLSYQGKHYFEAVVVSGKVEVGDIASKKSASCLVLPPR